MPTILERIFAKSEVVRRANEKEAEYGEMMVKYTDQLFTLRWLHEQIAMGCTIKLWHSPRGYHATLDEDEHIALDSTFLGSLTQLRHYVNAKPGPGHELSGWGDAGFPPGNE